MPYEFASQYPLDPQTAGLLEDLEVRCRTDVDAARDLASWRHKAAVEVRSANVASRDGVLTAGHTIELRRQGALCLTSMPMMVGSFFHLTFEREALDVAPIVAVCDRCTMLSDASFELRFQFVHEIDLPPTSAENEDW